MVKRHWDEADIHDSGIQRTRKIREPGSNEANESLETSFSADRAVSTNNPNLCEICSSLDIEDVLLTRPKSSRGRFLLNLGPLKAPYLDLSCSFCRLLSVQSATFPTQPEGDLLLYAYKSEGWLWSYGDDVVLLAVKKKSGQITLGSSSYIGSISPPSYLSPQSTLRARLVAPDHIDYSIISKWVTICKQDHSICRPMRPQQPMSLYLVDCNTREIISADSSYQYVALSYVWGTSSHQHTAYFREALRPGEIPLTIEDAITVTRKLGLQYLWIDRYCINQLDANEKHAQIRQMDKIYQAAYITIIAAAGSDPTYGLPGVSKTPRIPQPQAKTGGHIFASLMTKPSDLINQSVWMSRGWTYQESLCSRRRLFFTDQYVHYECTEANWSETYELDRSWSGCNIFTKGKLGKYPWEILKCISTYARRQLTYDSDALNGMRGVLRLFEGQKHPISHFWGVPILPCAQKHANGQAVHAQRTVTDRFISGLCWKSTNPGHRRPQFPSWSWTGWACEISSSSKEYENNQNAMSHLDITVEVFHHGGSSPVRLEEELRIYKKNSPPPSDYPILCITALVVELCVPQGDCSRFFETANGHVVLLSVYPVPKNQRSEDINLRVNVNESIQISEATEKLQSQYLKGIILGDTTADVFMLIVKRVTKADEMDTYERLGSCRVLASSLIECVARQSIFLV